MNLALPDFRIASAVSLNSLLGDEVDRFVELPPVAQPVDEEEIDVISPERREPLVDHFQEIFGGPRHVLGDEDDLLANLGGLLEPILEKRSRCRRPWRCRRGERRWRRPAGECGPGPRTAPLLEDGDLDAGLPQLSPGERRRLGRFLACDTRCDARGRGGCHRSGLEKLATIGPIHLVVAHLDRLLITKVWNASLPDLMRSEAMKEESEQRDPSRCHGPNSPTPHCTHSNRTSGNGSAPKRARIGIPVATQSTREKEGRPLVVVARPLAFHADAGNSPSYRKVTGARRKAPCFCSLCSFRFEPFATSRRSEYVRIHSIDGG